MLAFGIRFLNGYVAASERHTDFGEAEWPPHPGRVFMALAAAHFETGADSNERRALEWVESLQIDGKPMAPLIAAPGVMQRDAVTHYVPVDKKAVSLAILTPFALPAHRVPRAFPRAWLNEDRPVYMVWPDAHPDERTRASLENLCAKVTRVGHSSSMVQMWVADEGEPDAPDWLPDGDRAEARLRLAPSGTMKYLEDLFDALQNDRHAELLVARFDAQDTDKAALKAAEKRLKEEFGNAPAERLRPVLSHYHGYARATSRKPSCSVPSTVFDSSMVAFRIEALSGPFSRLDLVHAPMLVDAWRKAAISHSNGLPESARSIISGHAPDGAHLQSPHMASVPLAFVEHRHADGHILGVGIALPEGVSQDDRLDVLRAVGRIHEIKLGRLGRWRVTAAMDSSLPLNLRAEMWTACSRGAMCWATVTPIALDRHPKSRKPGFYENEAAALVARSCAYSGLPRPREVVVSNVAKHTAVPAAHEFPRLKRKDGSGRHQVHALLVFDEPVRGPVIVGAGRYRGYGMCRPVSDADVATENAA